MSIIKRRKTSEFAQIHNQPLQNLEDIRSIGLLAHLMSLPENWEIRKMQLYKKFGRSAVVHAVNELESKKLWVDIKFRIGKKNEHIYHISDQPFDDVEVISIMKEVQEHYKIMEISPLFSHLLSSDENQQLNKPRQINDSSSAKNEHFILNNSCSNVENEQLLNTQGKINNIQINIDKENIVNNNVNNDIDKIILEFMNQGLSKSTCYKVLEETKSKDIQFTNFPGYFRNALRNALHHSKVRQGDIDTDAIEEALKYLEAKGVPSFNWLAN